MFKRLFFPLAILAATASSALSSSSISRELAGDDFQWDIEPEDGFPIIAFNNTTEDSEVFFKYNFTGTLSDSKFFAIKLYESDCISL
jgi:hypothetical protein